VITPTPVEVNIMTSDLVSTPEFDFISNTDLSVTLPSAPSSAVNYFINICTEFSAETGEIVINYDSCKLRTILKTEEQLFTLTLSTAESMLIAQIWPVEVNAEAITLFWNISESGNNWKIALDGS
jgi:hypothetical protein